MVSNETTMMVISCLFGEAKDDMDCFECEDRDFCSDLYRRIRNVQIAYGSKYKEKGGDKHG